MTSKVYNKEFQVEIDSDKDALASVAKNSQFNYIAFILTDDEPNINKQKVPEEEFDNLIKSGFYAPLKMAYNEMKDGHEDAFPLGPITHLTRHKNQIKCIAALWSRERPEDVEYIKNAFAEKLPLNISWEILYQDSFIDDDGIENLTGTSLRAATLVGLPAYAGRTPVVAVASKKKGEDKLDDLEKTKEELTSTKEKLSDIEDRLKTKSDELVSQAEELTTLREYKATVEGKIEEEEKFDVIKKKFSDAGIEKEDEYFSKNKDLLLSLSSEALEFMIQELVAFSSDKDRNKDSSSSAGIPNLSVSPGDNLSPKELGQALRKRLEKKE